MKKLLFLALAFVVLLITSGCQPETSSEPNTKRASITPDVNDFVKSYKFPKLREKTLLLNVPEQDFQVFQIQYGEGRDCEAGCFYHFAIGLKYNNKIGWVLIKDYDDFNKNISPMYNVDSNDKYLFSNDFSSGLSINPWGEDVYQRGFLPLLAKDPDTPDETILKISKFMYIEEVGLAMLERPIIYKNKEILTWAANLSYPDHYEYAKVSSKAQKLLNELKD
ncbi:hypothetical protein HYX00_06510 [Candidatus Woesearchaeota archaeon]|nr:hypothetical protein [Candidatus Woesearchaeota archaeon]